MKRVAIVLSFLAVLCPFLPRKIRAQMSSAGVEVIQMTAKRYAFTPATITVKRGERVKLIITALDREHGFKLPALNIDQKLKKGVPTTVEFTADKAGTFTFKCSVFCGLGHHRMKGKLIVEDH